ncbi:Ankyrin repeat-containing domain [Penicillium roqueforti FM164]|uniref:Ankyrin repeat-containing domain n=1 Tax=Penicillium roqueforti (strain FM164) TaxID=1365484 RepID=W6Q226_PENRF|nr:Ankyrin repeat-containing domain [Penicillium roqueforti FM164]
MSNTTSPASLNAASQGHTVAVSLLLGAGAQPDLCHPSGERKGSPLNCATRNATDILLPKSLLDFGADVNASGNDGKTLFMRQELTMLVLLCYYWNMVPTSTRYQPTDQLL